MIEPAHIVLFVILAFALGAVFGELRGYSRGLRDASKWRRTNTPGAETPEEVARWTP